MMYICENCGNTKEFENIEYFRALSRTVDGCGACEKCGSDMWELTKCEICGEDIPNKLDGVKACESCLNDKAENWENAWAYGDLDENKEDGLNGFVWWMFDSREIESILKEFLKETAEAFPQRVKDAARKYCREDDEKFLYFISRK